jgi:hypothetical protein
VGRGDQRSCCWVCTPPRKIRVRFRECKHTSLTFLVGVFSEVREEVPTTLSSDVCPLLGSVLFSCHHSTYFGKRILLMVSKRTAAGGGADGSNRLTLTMMVASFSGRYHIWLLNPE